MTIALVFLFASSAGMCAVAAFERRPRPAVQPVTVRTRRPLR